MAVTKEFAVDAQEILPEHTHSRVKRSYRPVSTRSWTLAVFLFVIAVCIGLTFFLDHAVKDDLELEKSTEKRNNAGQRANISTINVYVTPPTTAIVSVTDARIFSPRGFISSSSTSTQETGAPNPYAQLSLTTSTTSTQTRGKYSSYQSSSTSSQTSTTSPIPVGAPNPGSQLLLGTSNTDYFLGLYLPKIIAVAMQAFWSITYSASKVMEPFYQMSSIQGQDAKHTLLAPYLSTGTTLGNMKSTVLTDWILPLTALVYMCLSIFVSLLSEAYAIVPTGTCVSPLGPEQPCDPVWKVNHTVTNILKAVLSLTFVIIWVIVLIGRKRNSGVSKDPTSIAAMSEILVDSNDLVRDLTFLDADASDKEVSRLLESYKFRLGYFVDSIGQQRYGIHKLETQPNLASGYASVPNPSSNTKRSRTTQSKYGDMLHDLAVLALMLGLFGLILSYKLIGQSTSAFNKFMNSAAFGPRFLLSGLSIIISSRLKYIERRVRVMEVYSQMSQTPQPAHRSISMHVSSSPFTSTISCLGKRYYFAAFLSFVTVLSEVLMITVSGVPFGIGQTAASYIMSTDVSLAILGIMIVTIMAVVFIRRRKVPDLPRMPYTLANYMTYLCHSNLIRDPSLVGERSGEMSYSFEKIGIHRHNVPYWTINAVSRQ